MNCKERPLRILCKKNYGVRPLQFCQLNGFLTADWRSKMWQSFEIIEGL